MIEIEECGDCFSLVAKSAWFQHRQWHIDKGFPFGEDKELLVNEIQNDIVWLQNEVADIRSTAVRISGVHDSIKKEKRE